MRNIAIFVSGEGLATERIVKLFNEGNRLKTVLVFADSSVDNLVHRLEDEQVDIIRIPDDQWLQKAPEVAVLLKEKNVRLIVLDGFVEVIADEILEAVDGEMVRVSSPELAPREVVNVLEADLRSPAPELPKMVEESPQPTTPESEWADALKIQFNPPKVPVTPPDVPENSPIEKMVELPDNFNTQKSQGQYGPKTQWNGSNHHNHQEPMPSTWLIWSVLATVLCCFIPGIIAIIFSSQVSSRYYAGDYEGARRASRSAEIWIIVSVVLGVVSATLYFPFMLLGW